MFSRFLMFSYCAVAPTESAHQDGHNGSIGQAICKTVGFVPDVPGFRFMPATELPGSVSDLHCRGPADRQNLPQFGDLQMVNFVRRFAGIASCNVHFPGFDGHKHRKHRLPGAVAGVVICVTTD